MRGITFFVKFLAGSLASLWFLFQVLEPYLTYVLFAAKSALRFLGYPIQEAILEPHGVSYIMTLLYHETTVGYDGGAMVANLAAFAGLACAAKADRISTKGKRLIAGWLFLALCHPIEYGAVAMVVFSIGKEGATLANVTIGHVINMSLAFIVWVILWREEVLSTLTPFLASAADSEQEREDNRE